MGRILISILCFMFFITGCSDSIERNQKEPIKNLSQSEVIRLQKYLHGTGYLKTVTGQLDQTTLEGLKDYEKARGLAPTGILSGKLMEEMGVRYGEDTQAQIYSE